MSHKSYKKCLVQVHLANNLTSKSFYLLLTILNIFSLEDKFLLCFPYFVFLCHSDSHFVDRLIGNDMSVNDTCLKLV